MRCVLRLCAAQQDADLITYTFKGSTVCLDSPPSLYIKLILFLSSFSFVFDRMYHQQVAALLLCYVVAVVHTSVDAPSGVPSDWAPRIKGMILV